VRRWFLAWYPSSETDVDGIFFRLQAQALQREGMKIGMVVPMYDVFFMEVDNGEAV
jgi:teichuronic acid biosynthesis glycosyltransferase TuaC